MPLYYSNFKSFSFSDKISRIFLFEQLFCMAFISYTERPISALGLAWEAGGFQLSDATGNSHTMVTEFLGCPSKSWPPYRCTKESALQTPHWGITAPKTTALVTLHCATTAPGNTQWSTCEKLPREKHLDPIRTFCSNKRIYHVFIFFKWYQEKKLPRRSKMEPWHWLL